MGFFQKIVQGIKKTKDAFSKKLFFAFSARELDDEFYENLEEALLTADVGITATENSKFFAILQHYYKTFFANAKNALLPIKTQLEVLAPTSKYLQSLAVAICFCDELESKSKLFDMCTLASKYEKPRATVSPKASDEEKLLVGYVKDYL